MSTNDKDSNTNALILEDQTEESIIAFIKSHGQVPIPAHTVKQRTVAILTVLRDHKFNLRILRIGCHSISNIAMEIRNCEILVREGVIKCILCWIEEFITDWRICWLACSSLWNLARCKLARDRINIRGVELVLDIIDLHCHSPLVMQTSLGALSNLCIDSHIKRKIGNNKTIKRCFEIMDRHPYDAKVLTSACGLITNLAYDEEIAQNMHSIGISKIIKCMNLHRKVNHLQRNASAALSNLSATDKFVQHLVISDGIEALFEALKYHSRDADVTQLASGALQNLSIYGPTTSLHVSATFCDSLIVRQVLLNKWNEFMDTNVADVFGDTPLHSSIRSIVSLGNEIGYDKNAMADRLDVLQFLIAAGADLNVLNKKKESPLMLIQNMANNENENDIAMKVLLDSMSDGSDGNDNDDDDSDQFDPFLNSSYAKLSANIKGDMKVLNVINLAMDQGKRHLKVVRKRFVNLVTSTRKDIPSEIACILGSYCHPLELSIAFRVELEPSFKLAKHSKSVCRDGIQVLNDSDLMDMDVDL